MASNASSTYFSNHSQRFTSLQTNTSASSSASAHSSSAPSPIQRPTLQTKQSAHFSNKVLHSPNPTTNEAAVHPLRHTWVIWFQHRAPGSKTSNYESGIKRISSFSSIESFWSLFTHLHPPSLLTPTTDYLLFHSAVKRPVWEDPINERGGKWIVRLKKGVADRVWEEIVLAVIGDQFMPERERGSNSNSNANAEGNTTNANNGSFEEKGTEDWWSPDEICGCTISVRSNEDILAVWHRNGADEAVRLRIRDIIRRILHLNPATVLEYKSNNDSMQDKSSFRTTPAVERTLSSLDRS